MATAIQPDQEDNRVSSNAAGSTFHEVDDQHRAVPAIEFREVHLAFDDRVVLNGLNFKVMKGETKIILGGAGGGKSTIIKLVLGLLKPDAGQVLVAPPAAEQEAPAAARGAQGAQKRESARRMGQPAQRREYLLVSAGGPGHRRLWTLSEKKG